MSQRKYRIDLRICFLQLSKFLALFIERFQMRDSEKRSFACTSKQYKVNEIIEERDRKMWENITGNSSHPLNVSLPMKRSRSIRSRGHNYVPPKVSGGGGRKVQAHICK